MTKGLRSSEPQTREFTINLARATKMSAYKEKAPRAIKKIRNFAKAAYGTTDVRISVDLNKFVWGRGIRKVPRKVRVRCKRMLNENEDAKEKYYTLVTHVPVPTFKGLVVDVVKEE